MAKGTELLIKGPVIKIKVKQSVQYAGILELFNRRYIMIAENKDFMGTIIDKIGNMERRLNDLSIHTNNQFKETVEKFNKEFSEIEKKVNNLEDRIGFLEIKVY